ncbi:MAG TPA: Rv3235 family protein [Actinomycetes bacterium]|jgi:hypothetical protein|nr:Rv3235 family protein [Actinomycetes bacterium]
MPTSSAPEPLPHGARPLKVAAEPARLRPVAPPAPDRRQTGATPSGTRRRAKQADRGQPLTLIQGGQSPSASRSREDTRGPKRQEPIAPELASPRRTARRALPPPAEIAEQIAIALFEVEAGYRSAAQLERLCAPELWDRLEGQVRRHGGSPPSGRKLIRVHYQELMPGVANTVAVVERGHRVQPVAMRLDARGGRWLVTELRY